MGCRIVFCCFGLQKIEQDGRLFDTKTLFNIVAVCVFVKAFYRNCLFAFHQTGDLHSNVAQMFVSNTAVSSLNGFVISIGSCCAGFCAFPKSTLVLLNPYCTIVLKQFTLCF